MRLAELCDLVATHVNPADRPDDLYVGLEHIVSGRFVRQEEGRAADAHSAKHVFQPGDVLYGKLRPYLDKAVLSSDEGLCTTELLVLRPKEGIDPRFVVGVVHTPSFVQHAVAGTSGVQHPRTSWHHISSFELPDFTSREQVKIANLLWKVHDAITTNQATVNEGLALKRAAMQKLFTCGLQGKAQQETSIGPVPESWRVGPLGQFANVISSRMAYTELQKLQQPVGESIVKVLGVKVADMNLPGNEVKLQTTILERMVDKATAEYRCAPPHTIIFPKRGAAIATNKKRISTEWTAFDPNVIGIVAGNELDQDFLFQWFQMFDLRTITDDGPTPQLNKKNLLPLNIPVPPTLLEQREIVTILDTIDRKIELHRKKRAVLDELFKALLHKLMTGEIHVSELGTSMTTHMPQ